MERNPFELRVTLDLAEELAAVRAGNIEIEEDHIGARGVGVFAFAPQERQRLDAAAHGARLQIEPRFLEPLQRQADVCGVFFNQQDVQRPTEAPRRLHPFDPLRERTRHRLPPMQVAAAQYRVGVEGIARGSLPGEVLGLHPT